MKIAALAFSNIRRTPIRSILTCISVLIATATVCIVLSVDRGYTNAVQSDLVEKTGVHLYITKEGCPIEAAAVIAQGGLSPLYVEENKVELAKKIDGVSAVLPFQLFTATAFDGSRTDIFMGVTQEILNIRPDWVLKEGTWFTDESSVILGAEMAQIENLSIGEKLYSEQFDREFTVSAILQRNYSQDDGIMFIPLSTAQEMIRREGRVSAIAIKLDDISRIPEISTILRGNLPDDYYVLGAKELSDGIMGFFAATRMIMFVMVIVTFGVSIFGIVNTMIMAVMERKREIAYLKCVGARRNDILHLITIETLIICITGAFLGVIIGLVMTPFANNMLKGLLIAYVPSGSIASPSGQIVLISFSLSIITGVVCALYPAWKASSIIPMEVLRNE